MGRGIYFISTHFLFSYFEFRSRATQEQKLLVGGEREERRRLQRTETLACRYCLIHNIKKRKCYISTFYGNEREKMWKNFFVFLTLFFFYGLATIIPSPSLARLKKKYPRTPVLRRWFFSICAACEWNETLCIPNFKSVFFRFYLLPWL